MSRPSPRAAVALFVLVQGAMLLLASGRARTIDEHSLHFMAESIVSEGGVAVPQLKAIGSFYGKVGRDGKAYAPYSPLQPLLSSVYLRVLGPIFSAAAARDSGEPRLLAHEAASTLINTTAVAAAAAFFLLSLQALGVATRPALLASLLLVFATPLVAYAKTGFSEPLLAATLAILLWSLIRFERCEGQPSRFLWIAGAAVAAAIGLKFAVGGLMAVALSGALLLSRARDGRALVRALLLPAAAGLLHMAWNQARFGSPWDLGYPEAAEMGRRLNDFDTPLGVGILGLLVSPGKGLFLFAPASIATLAVFARLRRRAALAADVSLLFSVLSLIVYARYSAWEGGYCFGPRYLVPVLPGLLLGLPLALESRGRRLVLGLCVLGVIAQIPGVVTSFTEDQMAGGRYYDASYRYRLDYTPAGQWALTARYAPGLIDGSAWDSPLGLGPDFWFVFLVRAGFHRALIAAWLAVATALILSGVMLAARGARSEPEDRGPN